MSALREWLLGMVAAALAVALAQALTPEGTVKKVGRLIGGLVLLLAAVRPLTGLLSESREPAAEAFSPATETETVQGGMEVMKTLIAQKTGAYIVDKGQSLGLACEVRVTVAMDDSGWPVPWEAEIRGTWTPEQKEELSRVVEEELSIPAQRQSFREEGA